LPFRVLIVEDSPLIRQQLECAIDGCSKLILTASVGSLAAGLQVLNRESVDVMLVDLGLPDGSGIALIRRAKELDPPVESMVVTIHADEQHIMQALESGAMGYILKDAMRTDITEAVLNLMHGGSPISPVIARALLQRLPHMTTTPLQSDGLTAREVEVLQYLTMGFRREEIADKMLVSVHTVHSHVKHIYKILSAHSSTEAIYLAKQKGWIQ